MATIIAPWISNDGAKMGVFCEMCLYTAEQDALYTPADFLAHIETCRVQPFDSHARLVRFWLTVSKHSNLGLAVA